MIAETGKKRMGRPPTGGSDPVVRLRLSAEKQAEVMAWAAENHAESFSSAVRRLIDLGMTVKPQKPKRGRK
jgi:hypothetical protein